MTALITPRTGSALRIRRGQLLAAATVAAASALVLGASGPASAGGTTAVVARSTVAAGEVLFWSRVTPVPRPGQPVSFYPSIVKAAVAAPTLVSTVLPGSSASYFYGPEVSPDGSKLAYVRFTEQASAVEVRDLATGSTTVLVSKTHDRPAEILYELKEPTWSPNGDTIAYVQSNTQSTPVVQNRVRTVPAAGGPSRGIDDSAVAAAWRPDGKLTVARFDPGDGSTALYITGAMPSDAVLIPGSAGAQDHAWSPDGTRVVYLKVTFENPTSSNGSIATLPTAGGTPTVIVPPSNDCSASPVWSSDGQRVYFTQTDSCQYYASQIKQVPRAGGAVSSVVTADSNRSPSVTTRVAAPVPSRSHDFNGDGYADVIGRSAASGDLRLYFGNGLALSGFRVIGTGWSSLTAIFSPGDFNGDGHPDVIGRTSNGDLRLYFGTGTGLSGFRVIGTGWGGFSAVFSPGDFNGDGHPDVIGRASSNGDLRLYLGNGTTLLSGFSVIGTRWAGFSAVFSPGDFNGDGHPDVIGRASSNGDLRLYFGTGTTLSGFAVIGTGWSGLSALFSPGDFNLDGRPDVIGRISNGDLRVYYGNGSRLSGFRVIGIGWNGINAIL